MMRPSAVVLPVSSAVQGNGANILLERLAELAINLGRVGRGQTFAQKYRCRFAAAMGEITTMHVKPLLPDPT
jgi:hypothetical protein